MTLLTLAPESVVAEGDTWTIAVNRNQDLLGKTMVVLRRPCTAVVDLTPEEWASLHKEIQRVVAALSEMFYPDQFNLAFLMNQDAQVHLHVIPRYTGSRSWNGRSFTDAHWGSAFGHEQQQLTAAELGQLAATMRRALR
jgi:diadenosine tetraphosphate (Ap4A) HIT family hydrolase